MKTNGQVLDLHVDLEKEQYDWKKDIIVNKSKLLEKVEEAEKLDNIAGIKKNIFSIKLVINYPKNDTEGSSPKR